jgi:hypothetical protein
MSYRMGAFPAEEICELLPAPLGIQIERIYLPQN